jgi:hypothetical protein
MAVCAASRRLTLSNVLQGVYRTELVRQHAETSAVNFYTQRLTRPTLTAAYSNSWSSTRPFSTSQAHTNQSKIVVHEVTTTKAAESDVLTKLTSTQAENSSETPSAPKSTSEKSKDSKNKTKSQKKTGTKTSTKEPFNPEKKRKRPHWQSQKEALEKKFGEGWHPRKKLPPDSLDTIRHLHSTKPDVWTTPVLAEQFKISPEAIRRILKSKWQPSEEERERREERWVERYKKIYSHMEELGLRRRKGEWTARVSDARKLGLEEKSIRRNFRRRSRSEPAEVRPDREAAPEQSAALE